MKLLLSPDDIERLVADSLLRDGVLRDAGKYQTGRVAEGFEWNEDGSLTVEVTEIWKLEEE